MIWIVDSGSTKADWLALDERDGRELLRLTTAGLNPSVLSGAALSERIAGVRHLAETAGKVTQVHFYGAGANTPVPVEKMIRVLQSFFVNASIHVSEDMLGAVHATAGKEKGIVCILGTGSNSCYFDGEKIHRNAPALGYLLMDEASANYFGKRLLTDYFYGYMPRRLAGIFRKEYDLRVETVKGNLYGGDSPNAYLGQFAKFMYPHRSEAYIKRLLSSGFELFIRNRILPYGKPADIAVHFVGSIAYYYRSELEDALHKHGLTPGLVVLRPIDRLAGFHRRF